MSSRVAGLWPPSLVEEAAAGSASYDPFFEDLNESRVFEEVVVALDI